MGSLDKSLAGWLKNRNDPGVQHGYSKSIAAYAGLDTPEDRKRVKERIDADVEVATRHKKEMEAHEDKALESARTERDSRDKRRKYREELERGINAGLERFGAEADQYDRNTAIDAVDEVQDILSRMKDIIDSGPVDNEKLSALGSLFDTLMEGWPELENAVSAVGDGEFVRSLSNVGLEWELLEKTLRRGYRGMPMQKSMRFGSDLDSDDDAPDGFCSLDGAEFPDPEDERNDLRKSLMMLNEDVFPDAPRGEISHLIGTAGDDLKKSQSRNQTASSQIQPQREYPDTIEGHCLGIESVMHELDEQEYQWLSPAKRVDFRKHIVGIRRHLPTIFGGDAGDGFDSLKKSLNPAQRDKYNEYLEWLIDMDCTCDLLEFEPIMKDVENSVPADKLVEIIDNF